MKKSLLSHNISTKKKVVRMAAPMSIGFKLSANCAKTLNPRLRRPAMVMRRFAVAATDFLPKNLRGNSRARI